MRLFSASKSQRIRLPIIDGAELKAAELSSPSTVRGSKPFPSSRWSQLELFGPNVLVGTATALERLIERLDLGTLQLTCVDHAIFVLTEIGDKPLSDTLRVVLWQRFGVPVYELYLGARADLVAFECEAQEGWHVQPGVHFVEWSGTLGLQQDDDLVPTGLAYRLETATCDCGRPGLRIVRPEQVRSASPILAATA